MTDTGIKLRRAVKKDAPQIWALIKGMAEYYGLGEQFTLPLEQLTRDGFPESGEPAFFCQVLDGGGTLHGMLFYYLSYSSWQGPSAVFEDLYILPEARGQGWCPRLLAAASRHLVDLGCCRAQFTITDDNVKAKGIYERLGAENMSKTERWELYRYDTAAIQRLAASHDAACKNGQ